MSARRKRQPWESLSISHPAFRPYAIALGQIALAWNGFHGTLAVFYCTIMGGGFANQHLAVWHAIRNDRAQRAILLAAARDSFGYDSDLGKTVTAEIKWINSQADTIEDGRDNALHSPLWARPATGQKPIVSAVTGLGHVRAKKLAASKRGLLAEFRWCRDAALVLTDYVADMDDVLTGRSQKSLPQRPRLPYRGQKTSKMVPKI